jgi:hypothetical protein
VNVTVLLVPSVAVVTLTVLADTVAVLATLKVAVTEVALTGVRPVTVTPVPDTLIAVAPVRLVPVRVTGTARVPVAGCVAELGLIEASVGPCTVNVTLLLVPPGAVTLTVLADSVAVAEIVKVAVTVVGLTTVRPLTVTPVPETLIAVVPVRLVPVRVTGTVVPRKPVVGAIEVSAGPITVNVTVLLVPPGVVTLTFLAPPPVRFAVAEIVKVAVT